MKEIVDRQLENRSKFVFSFNKRDGKAPIIRTLHFAENIDIKESVQTNYSEYTPLGSNGSVFTFLGARSRSFDVNFNITLPNIMMYTLVKPPTETKKSRVSKADYFERDNVDKTSNSIKSVESIQSNIEKFANDFINNVLLNGNDVQTYEELPAPLANEVSRGITTGAGADTRLTAILKCMYWVNLIRSSVMTSSKKPSLGPPIVSMVHGILYQNVPCIVTDYSISHDPAGGYDEVTMLPRILKFSMNLREVRLRGLDFNPTTPESSKMMPGWDSFIEEGFATFDPMNAVQNTTDQGTI